MIEALNRYAGAAYRNGHISKPETRRFVWKLTMFRLKSLLRSESADEHRAKIKPFIFNFLDPVSFSYNFEEVFLEEEYFFQSDNPQPVIIDCGSNIGLAAMYFKIVYPGARITAIEAHPTTYQTLEKNIADNDLTEIKTLNVAVVGSDEKEISLFYSKPGDLRTTKTREMRDGTATGLKEVKVPATRLSTIFPPSVDLLKMDIEGSEDEVIDDIAPKLGAVKNVIIEYHYSPGGGRKSLGEFITILEKAGFSCRMKAANPADKNAEPSANFVVTIYAKRIDSI